MLVVHFFDAEKMPEKLCMSNLRVFVLAVVHFAVWTSLFTCCTKMDLCHFQHWNDKPLSSWLCEPRGGAIAQAYAHFSVHVPHLKKNMPVPITSLPINTIYSSLWPAHQEMAIMHSHTEWRLPSSNNDSDCSCALILRRSFSLWRLFASDFDTSATWSARPSNFSVVPSTRSSIFRVLTRAVEWQSYNVKLTD